MNGAYCGGGRVQKLEIAANARSLVTLVLMSLNVSFLRFSYVVMSRCRIRNRFASPNSVCICAKFFLIPR